VIHTPDLYEGKTFTELAEGIRHAERIGFGTVIERGRLAADLLPNDIVYTGLSLGAMPAQMLAQTRRGARGALLVHSCVPLSEFGPWPPGVPLQIHTMENDEQGDVAVARELADTIETAELFLYPGDRHLFTDRALPDYDAEAASLLTARVLDFLDRIR
jgi:dienelactone hydrolase